MIINRTLDCGVRVVMEKIPYVRSAAIGLWAGAGSVAEEETVHGISHFIEHMMFKGTEKRTAKQLAEDVDRIGGNFNAFTGKEATCYYIKTLSDNLDRACEILVDMFLNSRFDPEEMEKEKGVICQEMKMIEDSPEDLCYDLLSEKLFCGTPLESPVIGTPKSLMSISRDDIKDYLNREYTRDNVVVSISGNFEEDRICQLLSDQLSVLSAKRAPRSGQTRAYQPSFAVRTKDVEQSHICLGVKGVPLEDDLYYPLALLSNIMGGNMSSRLFQNIREQKGLAYSVYSAVNSFVSDGMFCIYAGVSQDKIEAALLAIGEELHKLALSGVTEDELQTAKEQMKSGYLFGLENVQGRMFSIGKGTLLLNKVDSQEKVISEINGVTMEDIAKAAAIITDIRQYSGVLISRTEENLEALVKEMGKPHENKN